MADLSTFEIGSFIGMVLRWRLSDMEEAKVLEIAELISGLSEGIQTGIGGGKR